MKYITLASGVGTDMVAWQGLDWQCQFFSEIAKFPSAVLAHHYPAIPNLGDMLKIQNSPIYQNATVDLVFAGTPCQSFSVAGLRTGIKDPRGNLALQFLRIADDFKSRWLLWENVPGVFSSWSDEEVDQEGNIWQTNDFEAFIRGIQELGYSVAWRVLDAQYYGTPQRRRRVFVVGYRGDWRRAAAVLFEPESLRWNFEARKVKSEKSAARIVGGIETDCGDGIIAMAHGQKGAEILRNISPTLNCNHEQPILCFSNTGSRGTLLESISPPLRTNAEQPILCFQSKASASQSMSVSGISPTLDKSKSDGITVFTQIHPTVPAGSHNQGSGVSAEMCIGLIHHRGNLRRITPLEAERLQGYPDNYTLVPYNGKPAKDGPRYHAIGNGIAVPVLEWIGNRIDLIDKIPL